MKKRIIVVLAIILVVALLCGCGGNSTPENTESKTDTTEEQTDTSEEIEETTEEEEPEVSEEEPETDESEEEYVDLTSEFERDATIEETVLYDENNVKITAKSLTYTDYEAELEVEFENNDTKDLEFSSEVGWCMENAVNKVMVEDGWSLCEVPAGQKDTAILKFEYNNLLVLGINKISEIQVGFKVEEPDLSSDSRILTGPINIQTSIYDVADSSKNSEFYRASINDKALKYIYNAEMLSFITDNIYDSKNVKISSAAYIKNKDDDRILLLETNNDSESEMDVIIDGIKVNGDAELSGYSAKTVSSGCMGIIYFKISGLIEEAIENDSNFGVTKDDVKTISFFVTLTKNDERLDEKEVSITL